MKAALILMVGFPGSGKSTIAKSVAQYFRATYLDKDTLCNTLTGAMLESHGECTTARDDSSLYKQTILPAEYKTLFDVANHTLPMSGMVVVDAPFIAFFDDIHYMDTQRALYHWQDLNIIVVEVFASPDTTKQRLLSRGEARDQWKLDNWPAFYAQLISKTCCWKNVHKLRFDNSELHVCKSDLYAQIDLLTQH